MNHKKEQFRKGQHVFIEDNQDLKNPLIRRHIENRSLGRIKKVVSRNEEDFIELEFRNGDCFFIDKKYLIKVDSNKVPIQIKKWQVAQ
jgi:hypothetical protein